MAVVVGHGLQRQLHMEKGMCELSARQDLSPGPAATAGTLATSGGRVFLTAPQLLSCPSPR